MTLVFLDVETLGLSPDNNSIFQLSGLISKNGIKEKFNYYMKPYKGDHITDIAQQKTGKTQEEIESYPDQVEAYNAFTNLLNTYEVGRTYQDKAWIVGYNSTSFDLEFLRKWFEFNGDTKFGYKFWWPTLDVMHLAALYLAPERSNLKNFQLTTVYEYIMGKPFDNAHNAFADIAATEQLFNYFAGKMLLPLLKN